MQNFSIQSFGVVIIYNFEQGVWNKVEKSREIGQYCKALISTFA